MKYYLIAGEASGDLHGSNLIKGLRTEDPQAEFRFWGGDLMRAAAVPDDYPDHNSECLVRHYKGGAVMGVSDVLAKAGQLLGNIRYCKRDILSWRPDVVILIDYPGFNFKIAKFAHKAGFKVFYYIAPKTWASRGGRNRKLKKYIDKLFIVFPFEKAYFDEKGIEYIYKGNPLIDAIDQSPALSEPRGAFFERIGLPDRKYIALLAGSRGPEIKTMIPVMMQFADTLRKYDGFNDYEFIIAGAPSRDAEDYHTGGRDYVHLIFGDTYGVLKNAEAAVINSGTASLEAVLIGTPQVVGWASSKLTIFVAKKILKVGEHIKYISLGNLIIDKSAFKELIQESLNVTEVTDEILKILSDEGYRKQMLDDYADIRKALGGNGASASIARAMIQELSKHKSI